MREEESPDPAEVISWEERRLCPDGACVGVVGDDGACNVCGRVDPEAARKIDAKAAAGGDGASDAARDEDEDGDGDEGEDGDEGDGEGAERGEGDAGGDEWDQRKLCDDGACIGVVVDGRCDTCGKAQ